MALALSLGRRGLGRVWPWPSVGCVIVRQGRIIGRGTSDAQSLRHAEIVALDQAGAQARDATVYVTLEPCSHHGRTPPCADALLRAGVARVVVATGDPNPLVAGRGLARLRAAGITVETGLLGERAQADNAGFMLVHRAGRPLVTLKLATSLDGRIATASGHSQWITGPAARRVVHAMRACHDAVMVGAGTARADDPSLTVRGLGIDRQPVRVVVSRRLDLPRDSQLFRTARQVPVWLCHGPDAQVERIDGWAAAGARLIPCGLQQRQLDMASVLSRLAAEGLTRIFCEGGSALAGSLLSADLVDEMVGFTAGLAIGAEGYPAIAALGIARLDEAARFDLAETRAIGGDVLHRWTRSRR